MVTAVQSNAIPAGGTAAQQPVPAPGVDPTVQATTMELSMPALMAFRQQSTPLEVPLDTQSIALPVQGNQLTSRITNVGLGYAIITKHTMTWFVSNSSGGGAQTFTIGKTFPWSCIGNTQVQINGGAVVYSVSGYGGLLVAGRNRRGFFGQSNLLGTQAGVNTTMVQLTFGAGLTPTAGATMSGVASVSVALSTVNALLTAVWYTYEKLAFTRDGLLGALPLQNNSTFATVQRTLGVIAAGASNPTSNVLPFGATGANVTIVPQTYKYDQTYRFWSVPSNPALYAPMVQNSYQVLEQAANIANATGSFAATYNLPQNNYLTALHIVAQDSSAGPNWVVPSTTFTNFRLQYNAGSVIPVQREIRRHEFLAWFDYQYQPEDLAGYLLWDGNDTTEDIASTDTAGWVNLYDTANPQFQFDIAGAPTLPIVYSAIRESVVAGAVAVVGG